jgi:hypothetical protein
MKMKMKSDYKIQIISSKKNKQIITPNPLQQLLTKQKAREIPIIRKKIESVFESDLHIKFFGYFIRKHVKENAKQRQNHTSKAP